MSLKYWETMAAKEEAARAEEEAAAQAAEAVRLEPAAAEAVSDAQRAATPATAAVPDTQQTASPATEAGTEVKQAPEKKKLPRPLAVIFGTLLILVSMIGISLLTAILFLLAIATAVIAAALITGGGFMVVEAAMNITTGTLVSLQFAGIGLAGIALGLILLLAAIKCGFTLLPKTAGLYPKAIDYATNM